MLPTQSCMTFAYAHNRHFCDRVTQQYIYIDHWYYCKLFEGNSFLVFIDSEWNEEFIAFIMMSSFFVCVCVHDINHNDSSDVYKPDICLRKEMRLVGNLVWLFFNITTVFSIIERNKEKIVNSFNRYPESNTAPSIIFRQYKPLVIFQRYNFKSVSLFGSRLINIDRTYSEHTYIIFISILYPCIKIGIGQYKIIKLCSNELFKKNILYN